MNFRATSTFRAGDFSRVEAVLVPKLMAGATNAAAAVLSLAQAIVPVDTGFLLGSGNTEVEWAGQKVIGYVIFTAPYAAYVEFGTGRRGAASGGAGPYAYNLEWPGMVSQPYCRPALDSGRQPVLAAFREALAA